VGGQGELLVVERWEGRPVEALGHRRGEGGPLGLQKSGHHIK
jgi:hypothetical protein